MKGRLVRLLKILLLPYLFRLVFWRLLWTFCLKYVYSGRKYCSVFDVAKLSSWHPPIPYSIFSDSSFYGHANLLEANRLVSLFTVIEHGLYFGSHVPYESHLWYVREIITYSDTRVSHINRSGLECSIRALGPYINFMSDLYTEKELVKMKKQLGRTLLIFDSHSSKGFLVKEESSRIISEIDKIKDDFDTILVSVYYRDIERLTKKYVNSNFRLCCSGHQNDPNFLRRQRAIIQLSDMTMSNSVGTHIGYCISLNKPHYIVDEDFSYLDKNQKPSREFRVDNAVITRAREISEVSSAFRKYSTIITPEQRSIVKKYWG